MRSAALTMLSHCLYELRKGVRQLFLLTMTQPEAQAVRQRLERERVALYIQDVTADKFNLYFGRARYVEIARRLAVRPLNELSPEEDFMLGILLGYERSQQCRRYLVRIKGLQPPQAG